MKQHGGSLESEWRQISLAFQRAIAPEGAQCVNCGRFIREGAECRQHFTDDKFLHVTWWACKQAIENKEVNTKMPFDWNAHTNGGSSGFPLISREEKAVLVKNETVFTITAVRNAFSKKYGKAYAVDMLLEGKDRALLFSCGKDAAGELVPHSRDETLAGLQGYLAAHPGETEDVYLEAEDFGTGNPFIHIRPAAMKAAVTK